MFIWSLQISIISIILIFLVHHLITFFKTTLTVPKIKDLVNAPAQKYETMMNVMSSSSSSYSNKYDTKDEDSYKESLLPKKTREKRDRADSFDSKPDVDSMKNELKSFLKTKLNSFQSSNNSTEIATLDSGSKYSTF